MTNFKSFAVGTLWIFVSTFLVFAALEPVKTEAPAPILLASSAPVLITA